MNPSDKFWEFFKGKNVSFEQVRRFVAGFYGWLYGLIAPVVFITATGICLYKDARECWPMRKSALDGGNSYIFMAPDIDSPAVDKDYFTKQCRNDGNVFTTMDTEERFLSTFPKVYFTHTANASFSEDTKRYYAGINPHGFYKDAPVKLLGQCLFMMLPIIFCLRKSGRMMTIFSAKQESVKKESKTEAETFLAVSSTWDALSWTETANYLSSYFEFLGHLVYAQILCWIYNVMSFGDWWFSCAYYYVTGNFEVLDKVCFPRQEFCFLGRKDENVIECTTDMYYWYQNIFLLYFAFLSSGAVMGLVYLILQVVTWHCKSLAVWRVVRKHVSNLRDDNPDGVTDALKKLPPGHLMILSALDDVLEPKVYRQLISHIANSWADEDFKVPPQKRNVFKFWKHKLFASG